MTRRSAVTAINAPPTLRDGRQDSSSSTIANGADEPSAKRRRPNDEITAPRRQQQHFASHYIEYDFSKMSDTKGGFLAAEDDPYNRALRDPNPGSAKPGSAQQQTKPAHMTLREWERHCLLRDLRQRREGPFAPGPDGVRDEKGVRKVCFECGGGDIDWKWDEVFGCRVCSKCKEKFPEKYSLLTKTEAREDYLLTDRKQCLSFFPIP